MGGRSPGIERRDFFMVLAGHEIAFFECRLR